MNFACKKSYLLLSLILFLTTSVYSQDNTILRVENVRSGWNKLKLGNNPSSFWNPKVDVTAGGNTVLEVEFRIPEGTPDMSRVQVRPNGFGGNPVNIGAYLPGDFSFGHNWYSISIPLADFDPLIDFTKVYLLQLPYSSNTTPFVMELRSVVFTGGSTPYVWFGEGKRDNIHDGQAGGGQMTAALEKEYYIDYRIDLAGEKVLSDYYASNYFIRSDKCQELYVTGVKNGMAETLSVPPGAVADCRFVPGSYLVNTSMSDGTPAAGAFSIPPSDPLSATTELTPPDGVNYGNLKVTMSGGTGSYFLSDYGTLDIFRDSSANYTYGTMVGTAYEEDYTNIQTDLEGNSYFMYKDTLQKRDVNGTLLWELPFHNLAIYRNEQIFTDLQGYTYVVGEAGANFHVGNHYAGNDIGTYILCRINPDGQPDWVRKPGINYVRAIKGDGKGHIYILTSLAEVYKYSIDGHQVWHQGPSPLYNSGYGLTDLAVDDDGNVYIGTLLNINDTYAGQPVPDFDNAKEDLSVVVIKLNSNGNLIWIKPISFASDIRNLVYTNFGLIYFIKTYNIPLVLGTQSVTSYVEAIDLDGNEIFQKDVATGVFSTVTSITADPSGYIYVGANPNDITKLDPLGVEINKIIMPTQYYYAPTPYIVSDKKGGIVIAGINGDSWDDLIPGLPYNSMFIARLEPANTVNIPIYPNWPTEYTYLVEDARGDEWTESIPFNAPSISAVSFDLDHQAYEITWNSPIREASGYEVYRKAGGEELLVGQVSGAERSFLDQSGLEPGQVPAYSVKAISPFEGTLSKPHSPSYLSAEALTGGKVQITWQPYTGFKKVAYTLWRGTHESDMTKLASLSGNSLSYTDQLPASGEDYVYRLEVTEKASGASGTSLSNLASATSQRIASGMTVWPNPAQDLVHCRFENRQAINTLQLTDITGRVVSEFRNIDPAGHTISRQGLPVGVYLLSFEDAEGKTTERIVFR